MNGLSWGLGALFLEVECFFFSFKTLWSWINMSILCSEYESPIYSSLHLDKMRGFVPYMYLQNRREKA